MSESYARLDPVLQPASPMTRCRLLNIKYDERKIDLARYAPSADLAFFVAHYWFVSWDLRGQEPYSVENLPYPCVHLTVEPDEARLTGVWRGKSRTVLTNAGRVFGIQFKPGGFYPFIKRPVSHYTGRSSELSTIFGPAATELKLAIQAQDEQVQAIKLAEHFLSARLPEPDERVELVQQIIDSIILERALTSVEDVVRHFNLSTRTLQRLFSDYVGISPKWVIKRYRLHEAAERVAAGEVQNWSKLALELGYFDQAHFIKDFKAIVGHAPAHYSRAIS
ncbi:AraC family transcriptional regulator [Ktedonosporobacter rubrisoli]|uniref:AraC family transcriptional regulator n=1 Tax=Ktedonosporobacter rubrisoli TaxID=2509675 RepID=A0A4P6JZE2_KTERU|nr:helix-turn-helix domain-containing protein [Ktedonosporobacter rubrisoli]QBD80975.1 AraC family transcriptional regulator [Ktedonosporobacter rubrisoli]